MSAPVRYRSAEEDSARWSGFPFRAGDIVISTRSKSGTTWMQQICALLVLQRTDLPEPLSSLSPWLDWLVTPRDEVYARLGAQRHRRVIKTHTPLDGIPLDPRAAYVVVARHPLDLAVSLYHHGDNIDRVKLAELVGSEVGRRRDRPPLRGWLERWIASNPDPRERLDSLPGVLWHLSDAWRRRDEPNVLLVRYADLHADLDSEMRRIADRLGIAVDPEVWSALVEAATYERMRAAGDRVVPGGGVLKDAGAFFRRGAPGAGAEVLDVDGLARYRRRAESLAPPDLLTWLHG